MGCTSAPPGEYDGSICAAAAMRSLAPLQYQLGFYYHTVIVRLTREYLHVCGRMTSAAAAGCGSLLLTVRGSSPTSTQLIRIETEQEADAADRPTGLSVPVQSSATAGEIDLRRGERACRPARRAVRPGRTMQPPPPPPVAYLGR